MKLRVTGTTIYECTLLEEDEAKVMEFVNQNDVSVLDAIRYLQEWCEIDVYADSINSDYITDSIEWSEFDDEE